MRTAASSSPSGGGLSKTMSGGFFQPSLAATSVSGRNQLLLLEHRYNFVAHFLSLHLWLVPELLYSGESFDFFQQRGGVFFVSIIEERHEALSHVESAMPLSSTSNGVDFVPSLYRPGPANRSMYAMRPS